MRHQTLLTSAFVSLGMVLVVNGRQCVAVRVYPGREDSVGVSDCAKGRTLNSSRWTHGK